MSQTSIEASGPAPIGSGLGQRVRRMVGGAQVQWPRTRGPADAVLFGTAIAIIALGVVMVYSASSVSAERVYGDGWHFLIRQAVYALVGIPLILATARVDYHRYRALTYPALLGTLGLLLLVVVLGRAAGGAARWIQLGPIHVQPAELAKLVVILWLAHSLSRKHGQMHSFSVGFLPHVLIAGVFTGLCLLQPDFGSSVMIVLLAFALMFVAGAHALHMLAGLLVGAAGAAVIVAASPYRARRVLAFLEPMKHRMDGAYQLVESWNSFGAGGLTGVGLGDSRQKLFFLPEAHTDFIAAIVAEELGFVGFVALLLAYVVIVVRGLWASVRAVDRYGVYLASGITLFIGMQAFTNFAVVLGLLPTKGLTLPFMSFGGSSLLVNCAAMGVLLNVSRPREPVMEAQAPPQRLKKASAQRNRNRPGRLGRATRAHAPEGTESWPAPAS